MRYMINFIKQTHTFRQFRLPDLFPMHISQQLKSVVKLGLSIPVPAPSVTLSLSGFMGRETIRHSWEDLTGPNVLITL